MSVAESPDETASERRSGYSRKVASIRAHAAVMAEVAPRRPAKIFNTAKRAARGQGVPPSKVDVAPCYADSVGLRTPLRVERANDCWRIVGADDTGPRTIFGDRSTPVFAEAGSLSGLLPWLGEYAREVDRIEAERVVNPPSTSHDDRDVVEDIGLADGDDRIGTGPHAVHVVEAVAQ